MPIEHSKLLNKLQEFKSRYYNNMSNNPKQFVRAKPLADQKERPPPAGQPTKEPKKNNKKYE